VRRGLWKQPETAAARGSGHLGGGCVDGRAGLTGLGSTVALRWRCGPAASSGIDVGAGRSDGDGRLGFMGTGAALGWPWR
jgi:hypothetical protein